MDYIILVLINVVIILDICVLIVAGFIFQYVYKNRLAKIEAHMVSALGALIDESVDIGAIAAPDKDMTVFYDTLKDISEVLSVREYNRKEVLSIANSIAVNIELTALLDDLLPKIIKATSSACAAFYMANHATNKLEIKSSIGFSKNIYSDFDMTIGEGLIGSTTKDIKIINDIPEDSIFIIKTYLGKIKPRSIMIIPIINQDKLVGILSLAGIYPYRDDQNEIIELIRYYVGVSIGNAVTHEQTKRLTNELRFQNALIQNLNEDLERKIDNRTLFLNNIIDSILDYAIYALDVKYNITAWNKAAEQILGYTKDEVIGKRVEVVLPDANGGKTLQNKIEAAIRDGRYEESGRRIKKDGTSYYGETLLFPIYNSDRSIVGFTNVIKDITYIKNIERALGYEKEFIRKIIDGSHEAVIVTTNAGEVELANEKSESLLEEAALVGGDLCGLFLEPDYLRQSLKDVASRYGKGDWRAILKKSKKSLRFTVYVMMETGAGDPKLFIYMTE